MGVSRLGWENNFFLVRLDLEESLYLERFLILRVDFRCRISLYVCEV